MSYDNDDLTVRLLSNVSDMLLHVDQEGMSYMEQNAINIRVSPTNRSKKSSYKAPRLSGGEVNTTNEFASCGAESDAFFDARQFTDEEKDYFKSLPNSMNRSHDQSQSFSEDSAMDVQL